MLGMLSSSATAPLAVAALPAAAFGEFKPQAMKERHVQACGLIAPQIHNAMCC